MAFWLITLALTLFCIALFARAMLRPGRQARSAAEYDVQVYRDQLSELERDLARGTIGAEEAGRARLEISRRLLEADKAAQAGPSSGQAPRLATGIMLASVAALMLLGGYGLYSYEGAFLAPSARPGSLPAVYPDFPLKTRFAHADEARANRASQADVEADMPAWQPPAGAEAEYLDLIARLKATLEERPDDLEGYTLLAQHEAQLGNFAAAYRAQARVAELKGEAVSANDLTRLGEMMVIATGGYVSPEAEAVFTRALDLDPRDPIARYYIGQMFIQTDRPDRAFVIWRDLLEQSLPQAPWYEPIRSRIGELAYLAGVDYTPPAPAQHPPMNGPSAEDIAAAGDMSPEDRAAMVEGMVNQLMDRLATEGGTAPEWARLISALGVQGDLARAEMIWGEAQTVFADFPDELALINQAAADAGLGAPVPFDPAEEGELRGPSAEDIAAAGEMTPEDRARMIDDMVTRLSDELATLGGPPEKWVQLINALGVLGETDRARAAWVEAQKAFGDDPDGLAQVRAAAVSAGVAE